jgi:hypothetical protein
MSAVDRAVYVEHSSSRTASLFSSVPCTSTDPSSRSPQYASTAGSVSCNGPQWATSAATVAVALMSVTLVSALLPTPATAATELPTLALFVVSADGVDGAVYVSGDGVQSGLQDPHRNIQHVINVDRNTR